MKARLGLAGAVLAVLAVTVGYLVLATTTAGPGLQLDLALRQAPPELPPLPTGEPVYATSNPDGGLAGAGGDAVVYHPGGEPLEIDDPPQARLFHTAFGAWEPTLGIDDDGTIFYAARNSNIDPVVLRSRSGGVTWDAIPVKDAHGLRTHRASLDPYVWLDTDTGRLFTSDLSTLGCPPLSYTDDDGETWSTTVVCNEVDHQTVFGGPPASATPTDGYPNVVYYCANDVRQNADCSRSRDGGRTWTETESPAYTTCGLHGHGVVAADGTVLLPSGACGRVPRVAISPDEGRTWTVHQISDRGLAQGDHEVAVAVDAGGVVHALWTGADRRAYLSHSRDGGVTWTEEVDVTPPGVAETWLPGIAAGDAGRIALVFMGTEQAGEAARWNGYVAMTADALAAEPTFYAASVNDRAEPLWEGACGNRCGNIGDFVDIEIGPEGTPWVALSDSCPAAGCTGFDVHMPRGEGILGRLVGGPPLRG